MAAPAIKTDLPAYPVTPKAPPAPQVAKTTINQPFGMDEAFKGVQDADKAATAAADEQAQAEYRLGNRQAQYQEEQNQYISGLHGREQDELAKLDPGSFQPKENDLANIAGIFTMVGMMGAFLGGKHTTAAAANAQAALTGMLKGWQDGDDAAVARQKAIYDSNVAYLQDKRNQVRDIYKDYENDAVKLGIPTAQGRYIQRLVTEANADVMATRAKYAGAQATQKQADDILKVSESMASKQADLDTRVALADLQAQIRWGTSPNTSGTFTSEMGELSAALAEKGVSLPTGLRSRQQQVALYSGLLSRHPDLSVDQIADLVKAGKIDLAAEMKETQIAAGIAGRTAVAENEIGPMGDLVLEAAKKVPRTSFLPVNKLIAMSGNQLQDPNLRDLQTKIVSLLNAYDVLAARGGTDVSKREEAHSLITSADSLPVLERGIQSFKQEMKIARAAATAAEHGQSVDTKPAPTQADRDWVKKHPEDKQKFIDHFGVQP